MTTPGTAESIRNLIAFLQGRTDELSSDAVEMARKHWLGAWVKLRLEESQTSTVLTKAQRDALSGDFVRSFRRGAALASAWRIAQTALNDANVQTLTLGCLPYVDELYPHRAAKFSQDIDLLVHSSDEPRAQAALKGTGFVTVRGHGMWRIETGGENIELDLHTTPGEESRNPALAFAYGQTTESLLAAGTPWNGLDWTEAPVPGQRMSLESLADNRVIHFFKHYCVPLRHGIELGLLLRHPMDPDKLKARVAESRSGKVWAFVLEVLRHWDVIGSTLAIDPTTEADRAFVKRNDIESLVLSAVEARGEPVSTLVEVRMLSGAARAKYAWGVAWPPKRALLEMHGRETTGMNKASAALLVTRLRAARLGKVLATAARSIGK